MPDLITAFNAQGHRIAGCNEQCYDARDTDRRHCVCICAGSNHGVGLMQAHRNTLAHKGDWRAEYQKAYREAVKFTAIDQMDLFEPNLPLESVK